MKERLKLIRKETGKSQAEFGKSLSVSRDVISNLEYGRVDPKPIFIEHLCSIFDINKEWLLTGVGEMHPPMTKSQELAKIKFELSKTNSKYYSIISKLVQLEDEDMLQMLETLTLQMLEKEKKNKEDC